MDYKKLKEDELLREYDTSDIAFLPGDRPKPINIDDVLESIKPGELESRANERRQSN